MFRSRSSGGRRVSRGVWGGTLAVANRWRKWLRRRGPPLSQKMVDFGSTSPPLPKSELTFPHDATQTNATQAKCNWGPPECDVPSGCKILIPCSTRILHPARLWVLFLSHSAAFQTFVQKWILIERGDPLFAHLSRAPSSPPTPKTPTPNLTPKPAKPPLWDLQRAFQLDPRRWAQAVQPATLSHKHELL